MLVEKLVITNTVRDDSPVADAAARGASSSSSRDLSEGEEEHKSSSQSLATTSHGGSLLGTSKEMEQYIERFNASVRELFGPRPLKSICRAQETPLVGDLVSRNVAWGKDVK